MFQPFHKTPGPYIARAELHTNGWERWVNTQVRVIWPSPPLTMRKHQQGQLWHLLLAAKFLKMAAVWFQGYSYNREGEKVETYVLQYHRWIKENCYYQGSSPEMCHSNLMLLGRSMQCFQRTEARSANTYIKFMTRTRNQDKPTNECLNEALSNECSSLEQQYWEIFV